jgi:hypothetical protein
MLDRESAFWLEKSLHTRYAHKRKEGEWFELEPKDVEDVIEIMSGKSGNRSQRGPKGKFQLLWMAALSALVLLTGTGFCAIMVKIQNLLQ